MAVFHKIVVPVPPAATDLSERALEAALHTAAWSGATVILLQVEAVAPSLDLKQANEDMAYIESETSALKARAAASDAGIPAERIVAEVRSGDVVEAILASAEEQAADLIVMGTHGRSGMWEWLTGSTTEQVMARSPVSVVVVRPQGFPYLTE